MSHTAVSPSCTITAHGSRVPSLAHNVFYLNHRRPLPSSRYRAHRGIVLIQRSAYPSNRHVLPPCTCSWVHRTCPTWSTSRHVITHSWSYSCAMIESLTLSTVTPLPRSGALVSMTLSVMPVQTLRVEYEPW